MITDQDIEKLKKTFATKNDLDESEARTAFGFTDTQKQISAIKSDTETLKSDVKDLKSDVKDLKSDVKDLKSDVKDIHQQMIGMEQNIIRAIKGIKEEQASQKNQIVKLNKAVFSN